MNSRVLLRTKALAGSALLTCCMMTSALAAEPITPPRSTAATETVTFLSGGVGEGERDQINALSQAYNLKIITANANGEYLAGVNLMIRNEKGQQMLSTVAQGPLLLAHLPPGRYTVTAMNGTDVHQEAVVVGQTHQAVLQLHLADV